MDSWLRKMVGAAVKTGPVPQHVAFIMDGNRRWARRAKTETVAGHSMGFSTLKKTLEWCLDLGVHMVTVYAFSSENFKRSEKEVGDLMKLAEEKFIQLLNEEEMIHRLGVCVRVLGDVKRLPPSLQQAIGKAVDISKDNTRAILNVCFVYTAREEMAMAAHEITQAVQEGELYESDITEHLVEQCLYTNASPPPSLIIRSSGEVRLSDFLLWQGAYVHLAFSPVLWPDFSFWDLVKCFLQYQQSHNAITTALRRRAEHLSTQQLDLDTAAVVHNSKDGSLPPAQVRRLVEQRQEGRARRVQAFLSTLHDRRNSFFHSLAAKAQANKNTRAQE
ncbi:dehydrodolichyl diphosphate synthase [Salpingoeca rosetta]|uniref:Alkyl transferase n=1 Tax=Salpingoeca rosetta (strain ATCC 50818 / BSB-021) TaxID=946362 RepID=F2UJB5_SALR5|nr:dehydrodolichyl diphosphate synthase [Salpingoeca rosetta]EGD77214.1 dehydrodolichyl diphosphate synthase [Salpingoeca rosetta]|eukprot:XP_004990558.1 dehydrodolichyl diphosphate synthase [Salpingoeca rosetta]